MLTEKDYCDYGLIVELEQLGMTIKIDFACGIENGQLVKTKFYPNPLTLYEAQKWLREDKNIDVLIELETKDIHLSSKYYSIYISNMSRFRREFSHISKNFDSYEEALLEGIKTAVKILKEER